MLLKRRQAKMKVLYRVFPLISTDSSEFCKSRPKKKFEHELIACIYLSKTDNYLIGFCRNILAKTLYLPLIDQTV